MFAWLFQGHPVYFKGTVVLHKSGGYLGRILKESIKIKMHEQNFNKDDRYNAGQIWTTTVANFKLDS